VIDALTKVLVGLYEEPERPPNAVDYIKRYMGAPTGLDVEAMKEENKALKEEVRLLKESVEELNSRLQEDAEAEAED
jgi:FtsZ-binding cell division protein ZapB|tara:strand:- start:213 stop:443 length:231 start_codon:yes stop_codon:yes gene_type:complete